MEITHVQPTKSTTSHEQSGFGRVVLPGSFAMRVIEFEHESNTSAYAISLFIKTQADAEKFAMHGMSRINLSNGAVNEHEEEFVAWFDALREIWARPTEYATGEALDAAVAAVDGEFDALTKGVEFHVQPDDSDDDSDAPNLSADAHDGDLFIHAASYATERRIESWSTKAVAS